MIERLSSNTTRNYIELTNGAKTEQINNASDLNEQRDAAAVQEITNTKEKVKTMIDDINKLLDQNQTSIKFEFHEKLEEYYVTVIDDVTHEVVKEIPSRKVLDMYAAMTEFLGLLVDKKI